MVFFVAVITGDLGNVSILVLVLALILVCLFLCKSSISPKSRDTIFSSVTVFLNPVQFLFLVLTCFLRGFVSLLGLVGLFLDLTLGRLGGFLLRLFRLFLAGRFH